MERDIVRAKLDMLSEIWPVFGDQKIDILVRSRSREPNAMHVIAKDSGVELLFND